MTTPSREDVGKALLARIGAGEMTLALGGAQDLAELRPELARMGLARPQPAAAATPAIDPNGDPLAALSDEERAALERNPKLQARFLKKIEEAETSVNAAREQEALLADIDAAHAALERTDALADRVAAERAAARAR